VLSTLDHVLPTQDKLDRLAARIEHAYALRRTQWWRGCSTLRVWSAAALRLWQAHAEDPQVPLDTELYVASQPISAPCADPWLELAQPEAARRYRTRVYQIVRQLRSELKDEVDQAERSIQQGREINSVLFLKNRRLSPLGRYITAHRAGRADLAARLAAAAVEQHRSCPLYRVASLALLPAQLYPVAVPGLEQEAQALPHATRRATSLDYQSKQFEN
jgi:hypothetical protein